MAEFIPGVALSRLFYVEAVRPILDECFPSLAHSAARLGTGSEVLGFDDETSRDHAWGPRHELFLSEEDHGQHRDDITAVPAERLPVEFHGYSTHFVPSIDGNPVMVPTTGRVRHLVECQTVRGMVDHYLGFDPREGVTWVDWLATPGQRLAEVTGGEVFHDGLAALNPIRGRLEHYPRDVWLFVMAAQWQRISQEEAFVGRCGTTGDDNGSAVMTARLTRELMRLCLLIERRYVVYSKWLGRAVGALRCAERIQPHLGAALDAHDWRGQEEGLVGAYEEVALLHNELGVTDELEPTVRPFFTRGFLVPEARRFTTALLSAIEDDKLRSLAPLGSVDQFTDSTDLLVEPALCRRATQAIYC